MGGADHNTGNSDYSPKILEIIGHARQELDALRAKHVINEHLFHSELKITNEIINDLRKEIIKTNMDLHKNNNRMINATYIALSLIAFACSSAMIYKTSLDADNIILTSKILMTNIFSIAIGWPAHSLYRKMANIDIKITRKDGESQW